MFIGVEEAILEMIKTRFTDKVLVDKEQARKLISKKLMEAFEAGQKVDRFSDQASEYWAPAFDLAWAPQIIARLNEAEENQ